MRRRNHKKSPSKKQPTRLIEVEINEVGAHGDGVGDVDGQAVYVPMTMQGDKVSARVVKEHKNGIHTELVEVLEESDLRQKPICGHFGKCGGCQLQMMGESLYNGWVKDRVIAAMAHHGFDASIVGEPLVSPLKSRRRVALKVLKIKDKLILGFNAKGSAQVVDLAECPVSLDSLTNLFAPLKELLNGMLKDRATGTVNLTQTHSGIDMLVDIPHKLELVDRENLAAFAETHDLAAIHWQDQGFLDPVLVRREPVMRFGDKLVELPPAAFVQATDAGENALTQEMMKALKGHKRMADLFCGIGTFTLPVASDMQVLAVEGSKTAIDALQGGVNSAQGIKKVIALHRDLFRRPLSVKELSAFDAVVFDPPRAGAKEQVEQLAASSVETIVGISCNPNTFSRDARILVDGGYTLEKVIPVDQFLYSPHVEIVGVFTKKQAA